MCVIFDFSHQCLIVFCIQSFCLLRFIPRYFIIFDAKVNRVVSLISLFIASYNNARYFCALILHPETLLNSLISSINFLVASLGFSMYSIVSPASSDCFTSFPIWIP